MCAGGIVLWLHLVPLVTDGGSDVLFHHVCYLQNKPIVSPRTHVCLSGGSPSVSNTQGLPWDLQRHFWKADAEKGGGQGGRGGGGNEQETYKEEKVAQSHWEHQKLPQLLMLKIRAENQCRFLKERNNQI